MYYFKAYVHRWVRRLIERHGVHGTVLEVGCGCGENLEFLADLGFSGTGIDTNPAAVETAAGRLRDRSGITVRHDTLFAVRERFDFIVALDVIEHLADDRAALEHLRGLLQGPDSHLLLLVPAGPFLADDLGFGHFRRYERDALLVLLDQCGYRVDACITLGFPFLHYARLIANRLARLPAGALSPQELAANTGESDRGHPMQRTVFGAALDAVLRVRPARALLAAVLRTQDVFARHATGHGFLVLAAPR